MARLLQRLGVFSARHRKLVLTVWMLALLGLGAISVTSAEFSDQRTSIPSTESSQARDAMMQKFPAPPEPEHGGDLQLIMQSPDDGDITRPKHAAAVEDLVAEVAAVAGVTAVSNPLEQKAPYLSPDRSTAVATVSVETASEEALERVQNEVRSVADAAPLTSEVGGSVIDESPSPIGIAELIAAVVAFVILLFAYGTLVAAGANMLMALIGVGVGLLGVVATSALSPIQTTTPILALMLGMAVGIDYVLFIMTRFRAELRKGHSVLRAIEVSSGTAGSSVVFAGATVVIALAGLSVVGISFLTEMGLAAAGAVLVAVLMALTLTPAVLAMLGQRLLPKGDRGVAATGTLALVSDYHGPRAPITQKVTLLERWGSLVVRRPVACLALTLAGFVVVALPATALQTALSVPGGDDPRGPERHAYETVAKEFGAGAQSPLIVLAEGDSIGSDVPAVRSVLEGTEGVANVAAPRISEDGTAALFVVTAETGPLDDATTDLVGAIRDRGAALDVGATEVKIRVTGETAVALDMNRLLSDAFVVYGILVVALAIVLLVLLFRSILVPVIAAIGFMFSLAGALGASVAVFQWGWLDALVTANQGDPLNSMLPILLTGILFGLAMDYQVFLVSRMHEAHLRGLPPKEAVLDGFSHSAGVVAVAAAIMTALFAGFGLSESPIVASIGVGLAVGVLLDAFVVRLIIVPAALSILGDKAWWLPGWLDRLLPRIQLESDSAPEQQPMLARV